MIKSLFHYHQKTAKNNSGQVPGTTTSKSDSFWRLFKGFNASKNVFPTVEGSLCLYQSIEITHLQPVVDVLTLKMYNPKISGWTFSVEGWQIGTIQAAFETSESRCNFVVVLQSQSLLKPSNFIELRSANEPPHKPVLWAVHLKAKRLSSYGMMQDELWGSCAKISSAFQIHVCISAWTCKCENNGKSLT